MRPTIILAPITLALAASWQAKGLPASVTVDADTSATEKRWPAPRRPVTRANAARALFLAMLQTGPATRQHVADIVAGNLEACAAVVGAFPACYGTPDDAIALIRKGIMGQRAIPDYVRCAMEAVAEGVRLSADYCEEVAPEGAGWWDANAPAPAPILASGPARPADWFRLAIAPALLPPGKVGVPTPPAPAPVADPAPVAAPAKGKGKARKGKGA